MGYNYKDVKGKKNPNYKTGLKCRDSKEVGIYNTWCNLKQRCLNKKNPKYHMYGGRGIKDCDEWMKIENFYNWAINNGWKKGMSIDRIDNDGDYCPENCSWICHSLNSKRKTSTKITDKQANIIRERYKNGEKMPELAKEYGVVHGTIWFIINNFTHVKLGECTKALKNRKK